MRSLVIASVLAVAASSCAPDTDAFVEAGEADALDTEQGRIASDRADRACQVVLRKAERLKGPTGGFETTCNAGGVCWFVWQATIDVAASAVHTGTGTTAWVQWKSTDATTWSRKQAAKVSGGPAGFQRYQVRIDSKTVGPGMSATSLQRAKLELLPYFRLADGSRLFDHNRVTGDLDTYALVANNQWAVLEDPNVCRPAGSSRAVIEFKSDWSEEQHGPLLAGGLGVIEYDASRLTTCRGSSGGRATWDITARVRFQPSGQLVEQSVRTFDSLPSGFPDLSQVRKLPFTFTVPLGTQWVEAWFVNTGLSCQPAYDSNQSQNYRFDVEPVTPAPVGWFGNEGSSTSRSCTAVAGIPEPILLDGYIRERACSFVELDVWARGTTDTAKASTLAARVEATLDGAALPAQWLSFKGRVGNDARFRYELPRDTLWYGAKWSTLSYTLSFSTDGVTFVRDVTRTVRRDPTWCNPSWGSCS
ncbi:MAG: hypothetical protein JNK82_34825 [Myxococcaceae bacterium]|nr:hypothetical protein [Myxococcaceae bacterium]